MTFIYDRKDQLVRDSERNLFLKLLGGRHDQNLALFSFAGPRCKFEVDVYYTKRGLKFEWPGDKDEYGRAQSVLKYDDDAFIELMMSGFRVKSGECDHLTYNRELMEALICHYRYGGRYSGPIYFLHTGAEGDLTRSQVDG